MCVLSLICLFIISGEFDALHQLSVNRILWKYSIQNLKTADAVLLSPFMRDNGICDIPHATSQISVEPYSHKGPENVK